MKSFTIQRADGEERQVRGYIKGTISADTKRYGASRFKETELPPKVDLRPYFTAIENQGSTNSCTANAVAGVYEYIIKRHLGEEGYDVSRLFVYYNARYDEESEAIEDEGAMIGDAVKSLMEYGVCSEETWPFDEDLVNDEPGEEAYDEAAKFLIEDYAVVPTDLFSWKHCLAEGYPIVFGLSLYNSFDKHRKPGLVPLPAKSEVERGEHAGHAMVCVGYSDADQIFIVRNSWGDDWGDDGYCYIPYNYVMNPKYNDGDSWYIRRVDELALEEGIWGDDSSVTGTYETELASMSDEDYEQMLEAMGDIPLETRIALILHDAASYDGEVSEEELDEIASYMEETLKALGSDLSAKKVMRACRRHADDEKLVEESVELLGEYLSNEMLATIASNIAEVIGVDDVADEEQEFLDWLNSVWQLGEHASED